MLGIIKHSRNECETLASTTPARAIGREYASMAETAVQSRGANVRLVKSLAQILANCSTLSTYVNKVPPTEETDFALGLIERGTCFLPVSDGRTLAFFPSRFIGYAGNNIATHSSDPIDGRETNKAIEYVFEQNPAVSTEYEQAYLRFCEHLNLSPAATGNFGAKRKYWAKVENPSVEMPEPGIASLIADLSGIEADDSVVATQRQQLTLARIGQGKFRRDLEDEWAVCPLSGCSIREVLRASHIKSWSVSNNKERLDAMNGVLLSANYDALFDRHLISFKEDGSILISDQISQRERRMLRLTTSLKIALLPRRARFMRVHRKRFEVLRAL